MFFWYQRTGGEEAWHEALSQHRSKVLAEIRPAFVTVLDASAVPESGWAREQYDEVKYSGPFYADWDATTTDEAIKGFHAFLAKLVEMGVDLHSIRLFATGGRGFHVEIPEGLFMAKVPKTGVNHLPGIYREMAMEMFTDCLDMRVYTSRRGRMWRVPGIERSNSKFKVPLTVDEALNMTEQLYDSLCSAPRIQPDLKPPVQSLALSALYVKSSDKVSKGIKNRSKTTKDRELLAQFKGDFPGSVKKIMAGEGISNGVGFNQIAMQLAILANALGKSSDDLVKACEGLIKNHASDGRYNSPRKRRQGLIDLWNYTNESEAYSYSRGGIRSLVTPDFPTGDLDGMNENIGVGHVPEDENEDASLTEDAKAGIAAAASSLEEGLSIQPSGIYKRTADGWKMLSNVSFVKPAVTVDTVDDVTLGVEATVMSDGESCGRHLISTRTFQSRASLSAYCSGRYGIFSGSDTQAGVVGLMLQRAARQTKRMIYVVRREGLDLVQNPLDKSQVDLDAIWVGSDSVLTYRKGLTYKYSPHIGANSVFNTDIHLIKEPLTDTPDSRAFFHSLFRMNSETVIAQMLGWMVSCFHKQHYQRAFDQFPLLHPNGPASSGKTLTTTLLARMFHNTTRPKVMSAGGGSLFPFRHAWSASASVPLIIDEYKPTELRQDRLAFLLDGFRNAYNQAKSAMGGINRGAAESSFRDITEYAYSSPTVFMAEAQETQTAVVQRSILVPFNAEDSHRNTAHFEHVRDNAHFLPKLGQALLIKTIGMQDSERSWLFQPETVESRAEALRLELAGLRVGAHPNMSDRQPYNLAVVIEGLNFLRLTLESVFGHEFDDDILRLKQSLLDNRSELQTVVMSEAAKVINDMALISRTEEPESEFAIREGTEFVVEEGHIEILLREAFVKYFAWSKRKGFQPLYSTPEAFIAAMGKFPPVTDKLCLSSKLRRGATARIFRFNLDKLTSEGIEGFKAKSLA